MSIELLPLGVGDAFSARHYSTCLLVESPQSRLLVDCPHPIRKIMTEATRRAGQPRDLADVHSVVLTHLHADHCSGLESYAYFCHFALSRRARLVAHPRLAERLWDHCLAAGMDRLTVDGHIRSRSFEDYFEFTPLLSDGPVNVAGFDIECRFTQHHVPTTALRLSTGGATLSYSSDTSFDPGLIEWLSNSDLIVHETNLGTHTPYESLARLPESLRRRMRLVHYPDGFEDGEWDIELLREGVRVPVTAGIRP